MLSELGWQLLSERMCTLLLAETRTSSFPRVPFSPTIYTQVSLRSITMNKAREGEKL